MCELQGIGHQNMECGQQTSTVMLFMTVNLALMSDGSVSSLEIYM